MGGKGSIIEIDQSFTSKTKTGFKRDPLHHKRKLLRLVERGGDIRSFRLA
jgi:hypothetical protein